ncbi:family 2 glycosyl transferase [Heliophilum fasciatum]|uniref:Family 2 glycosyl transferase n=1 Tax=Heliophilum fasciatum TaxID=35700 RepID=A0A4R2RW92_9FIRM|nr:family 2 glycosyl transferase [Heliophilum fasciatum]MCW2278162.1 hypothetical protein [Heliophilum fasciatum]TCP64231.1 hypothetical protein EDD73_11192 [Heliophilum fasciatum]
MIKRNISWLIMLCFCFLSMSSTAAWSATEVHYPAKTMGRFFYLPQKDTWQKTFLKGVNIGAAKPGTFPGELAITKAEYLRWFQQISAMNANVIRVYTTMRPDFYDALYEFNQQSAQPLYLMHGVWLNEDDIARTHDAFADQGKGKNDFIKDACDLVDIIHGRATLPPRPGFASGEYKSDISPYVIGWILGVEWDPDFVQTTQKNNPGRNSYQGEFLYTQGATAFETFLAEVGDRVIRYETSRYQMQRPVSFINWLTTDPLKHPNEPLEKEDLVSVNTETIKSRSNFVPGLFAAYHVYPYYPDFLNYQKEYINYKDETGKVNSYQAYLRDLYKQHTVPLVVAEFGVPASRGIAHRNIMNFNQGNLSEQAQGLINAKMFRDIYGQGYAGALIFAWQDEWFKRTWNTMDFDLAHQRPFWSNAQTNEQAFGILAFDPGKEKSVCYVDGDTTEWSGTTPVITNSQATLYAKADEKYLYLMVNGSNYNPQTDTVVIPVDTITGQGNLTDSGRNWQFGRAADFLITIGPQEARILVDGYYDLFYFLYGERLKQLPPEPKNLIKNSGSFNPIYLCLNRSLYLPEDKKQLPMDKFETGKLVRGNANPAHLLYNSLTDYAISGSQVEIRIPWQLLNVMDPSTRSVMGDIYKNQGFKAEKTDGVALGAAILKSGVVPTGPIQMQNYSWPTWTMPTYHERLKASYPIIQNAFGSVT